MRVALAGEAGVAERLLRRVRLVLVAAAEVRDRRSRARPRRAPGRRGPPPARAAAAPSARARSSSSMAGSVANERAVVGGADAGERLARLVAGRSRPLGGGVGDRGGLRGVPRCSASARSSSSTTSSRAGRVSSSARSSSPAAARSSPRQSARRPAAASRSPARSARVGSGCPSSLLVAGGLFEVVAEDLVQLDQLLAALLEPVGEALVQLRPRRLSGGRRRRRRGSAGGGSGSRPRPRTAAVSGRISSRRTSAARRGVTCVSSGASACTAPRWKTSPSTAPRSSTRRSPRVELVEAGGEQRLQRRRHLDLVVAARRPSPASRR